MDPEQKIANLLGMARTAQMGGNQVEALDYYNRVLEIDPMISEAWLGKGKAAGWLSTLANLRVGEMQVAFNHAIASSVEDEKFSTAEQASLELNTLVATLYGMARNQLVEFASLDNTWPHYLSQVSTLLDALDSALVWSPQNRTTLENIIHLCKDNIEGYSFRDPYNNTPLVHGITPSYEQFLRDRMNRAVDLMRSIDNSYAAPSISKKQADACFVVTATMGDVDHPYVTALREFRSEWLLRQGWGRAINRTYYRYGPFLASLIEDNHALRSLSLVLLVRPAVWVARRILNAP